MNEPLRPSTLGEILDRTANLYRSRFLVFFGIAAVPAAVLLGFGGAMVLLYSWAGFLDPSTAPKSVDNLAPGIIAVLGALGLMLIGMPAMLGASSLSGAALCDAASTLNMGGTISISSAFKAVWKRGWLYVGLYVLLTVIVFVAPMVVWVVATMLIGVIGVMAGGNSGIVPGVLMVLVMLALMVYFVWILVRLCLAFPICVVERAGVGTALKRAWGLSVGTSWRIVVLFLLGIALTWVASLVLMVPLFLIVAMVPALQSAQHMQTAGTVMIIGMYGSSFLVQALTMPVYAIALVLFYYDQRVRKEGFDIELLMRQAGMVSEPVALPEPAPWMPPVQPAIVPRDTGEMAQAAPTEAPTAAGSVGTGGEGASAATSESTAADDAGGGLA